MQGLHEILEQFLVFQPENSSHITSVRETQWGPYSRGAEASVPLGRAHLFSLVSILRIVTVSKMRIQHMGSVRTGSDSREEVRDKATLPSGRHGDAGATDSLTM